MAKTSYKAEDIKIDENRVLLYHGSKSGIEGNIEPKSRSKCDFGKGFYMGTEPSQALTLICDYDKSKFYIVSVAVDELEILDVPSMDEQIEEANKALNIIYDNKSMILDFKSSIKDELETAEEMYKLILK